MKNSPESNSHVSLAAVTALATAMAGCGGKAQQPEITPGAGHVDSMAERIKGDLDRLQAAQADLEKVKLLVRARLGLGAMNNYDGCALQPFDSHFCISCAAGRAGMTEVVSGYQVEDDAIEMLRKEVPEMKNGEWTVLLAGEGNDTDGEVKCAKAFYAGKLDRSSKKVPRTAEEVTEATGGWGD